MPQKNQAEEYFSNRAILDKIKADTTIGLKTSTIEVLSNRKLWSTLFNLIREEVKNEAALFATPEYKSRNYNLAKPQERFIEILHATFKGIAALEKADLIDLISKQKAWPSYVKLMGRSGRPTDDYFAHGIELGVDIVCSIFEHSANTNKIGKFLADYAVYDGHPRYLRTFLQTGGENKLLDPYVVGARYERVPTYKIPETIAVAQSAAGTSLTSRVELYRVRESTAAEFQSAPEAAEKIFALCEIDKLSRTKKTELAPQRNRGELYKLLATAQLEDIVKPGAIRSAAEKSPLWHRYLEAFDAMRKTLEKYQTQMHLAKYDELFFSYSDEASALKTSEPGSYLGRTRDRIINNQASYAATCAWEMLHNEAEAKDANMRMFLHGVLLAEDRLEQHIHKDLVLKALEDDRKVYLTTDEKILQKLNIPKIELATVDANIANVLHGKLREINLNDLQKVLTAYDFLRTFRICMNQLILAGDHELGFPAYKASFNETIEEVRPLFDDIRVEGGINKNYGPRRDALGDSVPMERLRASSVYVAPIGSEIDEVRRRGNNAEKTGLLKQAALSQLKQAIRLQRTALGNEEHFLASLTISQFEEMLLSVVASGRQIKDFKVQFREAAVRLPEYNAEETEITEKLPPNFKPTILSVSKYIPVEEAARLGYKIDPCEVSQRAKYHFEVNDKFEDLPHVHVKPKDRNERTRDIAHLQRIYRESHAGLIQAPDEVLARYHRLTKDLVPASDPNIQNGLKVLDRIHKESDAKLVQLPSLSERTKRNPTYYNSNEAASIILLANSEKIFEEHKLFDKVTRDSLEKALKIWNGTVRLHAKFEPGKAFELHSENGPFRSYQVSDSEILGSLPKTTEITSHEIATPGTNKPVACTAHVNLIAIREALDQRDVNLVKIDFSLPEATTEWRAWIDTLNNLFNPYGPGSALTKRFCENTGCSSVGMRPYDSNISNLFQHRTPQGSVVFVDARLYEEVNKLLEPEKINIIRPPNGIAVGNQRNAKQQGFIVWKDSQPTINFGGLSTTGYGKSLLELARSTKPADRKIVDFLANRAEAGRGEVKNIMRDVVDYVRNPGSTVEWNVTNETKPRNNDKEFLDWLQLKYSPWTVGH
jgi:hypothetical protein